MYICTFRYTPEMVDCHFCMEYSHHKCNVIDACPYIGERIEAGAVSYAEVIRATFKNPSSMLRWRLRYLVEHYNNTMWVDETHEMRFYRMWTELGIHKKRDTSRFFAAIYLLSSNEDIWRRSYNALSAKGLSMEYIRMCGISIANYALVQAAKSIYLKTDHFTISDLDDPEAVSTSTFRLVVNVVLIARYGRDILHIKSRREES